MELFSTKDGEDLSRGRELPIVLRQPTAPVMARHGDALFILEARNPDLPWQLVRVSLRPEPRVESWNLANLLGDSAKADEEPQASIMALDESGETLAIVYGPRIWLVNTRTMGLRRTLRMAGPVAGVKFPVEGHMVYTLRRDDAKHTMLLGRTEVETGQTKESILLEGLPLAPVVVRFALSAKDTP